MIPPKAFLRRLVENAALAPRLRLLRWSARLLIPSYRLKWPQLEWWQNAEFTAYLKRFDEDRGLNTDRKWMLYQLLRLTSHVPGDTAECGVFAGATSYLICAANAGAKTHHIFDSFAGLSQPGPSDGRYWRRGDLACTQEKVEQALSNFDKVVFHPGWIPERFNEVSNLRFSFVHIDVDLAGPTGESIAFFYPRMEAGGIILCDDYGLTTCPGATEQIDAYLAGKPEQMLPLPDGGGFFIVGLSTGPPAKLQLPTEPVEG